MVMIMATSLPPSPTAAVTGLEAEFFLIFTISDFCSGDIRQQTTAAHLTATWSIIIIIIITIIIINIIIIIPWCSNSLLSATGIIRVRELPSTTNPYLKIEIGFRRRQKGQEPEQDKDFYHNQNTVSNS